jgi:hypothetical protein
MRHASAGTVREGRTGLVYRERVLGKHALFPEVVFRKHALFPEVFYTGSFRWDIQCPTGVIFQKLIHNGSLPLSHNIGYVLFTLYSQLPGILLCDARGGTLCVWEFYFLYKGSKILPPDPPPPRLNVEDLYWGRFAAPLNPRTSLYGYV